MIEKFEYLQNTVTLKIGYVNSINASNFADNYWKKSKHKRLFGFIIMVFFSSTSNFVVHD